MVHEALESSGDGSQTLAFYRAFAGTILTGLGVVLGGYVAMVAFDLINGEAPPKILDQAQGAIVDVAEEKVEENKDDLPELKLSPEIMRFLYFAMTFVILILPTAVATSMISNGTRLMYFEAGEAINILADRFHKLHKELKDKER